MTGGQHMFSSAHDRAHALALVYLLGAGCNHESAPRQYVEAAGVTAFIALPGRAPAQVVWDEAKQRLLIVDNVDNRIWQWTDKAGLAREPVADCALPAGEPKLPEKVTLGQAALLPDGTLLVTRFGVPGPDAVHGGVIAVHGDGTSELVPKLDRTAHRLGIVAAPGGSVYSASFSAADGKHSGTINALDVQSGETQVADGFGKLIGLAISDNRLFASDQSAGAIFDAPLGALPEHADAWHRFAELPKPDQICAGPDGSLFSGQFQAARDAAAPLAVRWITRTGKVTTLKAAPEVTKPSGVAYDPGHRRLFVADSGDPNHIGVHVFPVPTGAN
jgi:sugar lactone lactonase YvrE